MKLTDLIPDPTTFLALEPEELAGHLLECLNQEADKTISLHNIGSSHTFEDYPSNSHKPCQCALMEAWTVLEREGLVAPKPEESGWFFVTRRGQSIQGRDDYEAFRHASRFPSDSVHADFLSSVYPLYIRGDYETAIFQAFKLIEVRVKTVCSSLEEKLYGVDLMRKAFHP